MRIVHLCQGLPAANATGGGPLYYWQTLEALRELGHEVHLIACEAASVADADLAQRVASVTYVESRAPSRTSVHYWLDRLFRTETLSFQFPDRGGLKTQVKQAVSRLAPDLIWAEHILSMLLVPDGVPVVYAHHDFIHKLQPVRRAAHRGRIRRPDLISSRRLATIERALCRRATVAVSVSESEVRELSELGVPTHYLPVVGSYIPMSKALLRDSPRAYLFGRANTAMNMQRRNLRDDIWPHLRGNTSLEWHQLGEIPGNQDDSWRWLAEHFTVHGFVEDLSSMFRPGDLCIVPYRDDTGFRVKLVTAIAHGMVNVGYVETFRCAPEFVPSENCLAARSGQEFAELVERCARDAALRKQLSEASRDLYERCFTPRAQLPIYQAVLDKVTSARRPAKR